MAVGELRSFVVDVNDIQEGERFWSSVLGLDVQFDAWEGQYSRIGAKGAGSVRWPVGYATGSEPVERGSYC